MSHIASEADYYEATYSLTSLLDIAFGDINFLVSLAGDLIEAYQIDLEPVSRHVPDLPKAPCRHRYTTSEPHRQVAREMASQKSIKKATSWEYAIKLP